jgi:hypothetical protein
MLAAVLIALSLCQDPQVQRAPLVVLHLHGGGTVTGRIEQETAGYVEVRVDPTTTVGFERARIDRIERASDEPEPDAPMPFARREQWFVLHDGLGRVVGQVHSIVSPAPGGGARIDEEWDFAQGDRRTSITMLEECDAERRPVRAFHRERVQDPATPHLLVERVLTATAGGDRLELERRTLQGDPERRALTPGGAYTFPLLALEQARQHGAPAERVRVFDLQSETFAWREFTLRLRRKVPHAGGTVAARELRWRGSGAANHEWLDGTGRPLRREVNGACLVALPMPEAQTKHLAETRPEIFAPAFRAEAGMQFGLWLPNPAWEHAPDVPAGRLTAHAPAHRASVSVLAITQLDGDAHVEEVAETVLRQFTLTHEAVQVESRRVATWRGHDVLDLELRFDVRDGERHMRHRGLLRVLGRAPHPLAICIAAPRDELFDLEPDLQRLLDGLEVDPPAVQPVLQGPLADRRRP